MKRGSTPYVAHVFVCENDRKGERKSCADSNPHLIKSRLKQFINAKGWKGKVRVSTSGCLGLCSTGPNVIIYPQKILFSEVTLDDASEIELKLESIMKSDV